MLDKKNCKRKKKKPVMSHITVWPQLHLDIIFGIISWSRARIKEEGWHSVNISIPPEKGAELWRHFVPKGIQFRDINQDTVTSVAKWLISEPLNPRIYVRHKKNAKRNGASPCLKYLLNWYQYNSIMDWMKKSKYLHWIKNKKYPYLKFLSATNSILIDKWSL